MITKDNKVLYTEDSVIIGASSEKIPFNSSEVGEILRKAVVSDDVDVIKWIPTMLKKMEEHFISTQKNDNWDKSLYLWN